MKKILTLEDELEINDFYKDLFEDFEYSVMNATTYNEVVDIIKKEKIDLLIVDYLLLYSHSEKDGFQTARDVKKLSPDTKIIMISAHYPPELEKIHDQYGIDLLLRKPFDINDLIEHIKELLSPAA